MSQESNFNNISMTDSCESGFTTVSDNIWQTYRKCVKNYAYKTSFDDSANFIGWKANEVSKTNNIPVTAYDKLYMAYLLGPDDYKKYVSGLYKDTEKLEKYKQLSRKVAYYSNLYKKQLKDCLIYNTVFK